MISQETYASKLVRLLLASVLILIGVLLKAPEYVPHAVVIILIVFGIAHIDIKSKQPDNHCSDCNCKRDKL